MKLLSFSILLLFTCLLSAQEKKCADFKTGKFLYKDSKYKDWVVTRNDSIQTETNSSLNWIAEGTIKWTDDCNYELVYTKAFSKEFIGKTVSAKIIKIKGNEILCHSILEGTVLDLEMIKIE
jgi:hypothetical protein